MALAAAQVVDAVAARLVPMVATGGRVYTSRTWPLAEADLPAWRVTAEEELLEVVDISSQLQQHTLGVTAVCSTRATADLDDALHALAASGLALLFAGNPPNALQCVRITRGLATEGEAAVGAITLELQALFFTVPAAPETIIS
jgi:hypothetical protein